MMNKILSLFAILSLLFLAACGDDEPMDIVNPDLALFDDLNVDSSVVEAGDTLVVNIQATAGTNEINSLSFLENGERFPDFSERLYLNDSAAVSNILPVDGDDRQGFSSEITILAAAEAGSYEVEITVADDDNNSATVSFIYFVSDVNTLEGVLLNQAGPVGTGGLDLDNGQGTGSASPDAEIRDQGIDLGAEADSVNWIQRIAPITDNNVELAALSAEFDFDGVYTQAQVAESFDEAATVAESDVIQVGDVFAVRRAGNHYLLLVTDVNITPDNNNDSYTFTIKQAQ